MEMVKGICSDRLLLMSPDPFFFRNTCYIFDRISLLNICFLVSRMSAAWMAFLLVDVAWVKNSELGDCQLRCIR
jgi:hypothetical protein